jgi:hypothetical protein
MKTYKTHTELLKLDGKTVRFDYRGKTYKGKIRVENGYIYLCQDEFAGAGCLDRLGFEYSTMLFESDGSQTSSPCANIRLYKKTLDDLEQGDIVMDKYGEYKVLGVCGELYFIRGVDGHKTGVTYLTLQRSK